MFKSVYVDQTIPIELQNEFGSVREIYEFLQDSENFEINPSHGILTILKFVPQKRTMEEKRFPILLEKVQEAKEGEEEKIKMMKSVFAEPLKELS